MENAHFFAREINKNTIVIEGMGCYSYLVLGTDRAMMIDSGMSTHNLREFVETITSLPVEVVNTHGHFDHTGGNGWFSVSYMHPNAVKDAKQAFGNAEAYPLDYPIETVTEGHVFYLGGRTLQVIEIPAHNPGSIALLDKESRILFSGDELEAGQVLLFGPLTVEQHQRNMKKLVGISDAFDIICPAHNGTPIDKAYIEYFIENDQRVMDGIEGKIDCSSPSLPAAFTAGNEFLRRSEHKGSSIVYDIRNIYLK